MNIKIICVGKLKERFWQEAIKEYDKRLKSYCNTEIVEIKEDAFDNKDKEADNILKKINDRDVVIALDLKGKQKSSEELAKYIDGLGNMGKSNIAFIIGGSEGIGESVIERANCSISFSKMTFPHQMIRVFLIEQIYRAFKIIRNEPYHK